MLLGPCSNVARNVSTPDIVQVLGAIVGRIQEDARETPILEVVEPREGRGRQDSRPIAARNPDVAKPMGQGFEVHKAILSNVSTMYALAMVGEQRQVLASYF